MKRSQTRAFTRAFVPALALVAGTCVTVAAAAAVPEPFIELNGQRYHVMKKDAGSETFHLFSNGREVFTWDQLKVHVAAQEPQRITGFLQNVLTRTPADQPVDIFIVLRNQPGAPISREVWSQVAHEREALARGMREITGRPLQRPSMPEEIERDFIPLPLTQVELEQRRVLAQALDDLERDARREIYQRMDQAIQADQTEVAAMILQLGGEVVARVTAKNVLGARLTPGAIRALSEHPLVSQIDFDHAGEPELDISRQALLVHTGFWANNITGGVFDAGVLDTGVQMNHPALSSHGFLSNMGNTDTGDHGTHVAGIMVGTDPTYRGVAYGADLIVFALAGNITTSMSGMNYIAGTGEADVCNYSFGNGSAANNDYTPTDQFFDGVINTFSYLVSKSAGNGGFGSGNPTITHPAPAFNLLACANINDMNTVTRNDDWIASSSSRGPTAGGRKKPDIAAPGSNIMSANKNWQTGAHFINKTGTSMAAPHVGGAVLLLYDMGVNSTIASKAVLINTADATEDNATSGTGDDYRVQGSRWNRRYGWGYMHLGKAYLNGLDYFTDSVRTTTPRDRFRLYAGQMFEHEKATLVWERHVAYNGSTYPTQIQTLSDLDLFAYRQGTNQLLTSSTSAIDNVEQISVPSSGMTVLKVKAVGSFSQNIQEEPFALATQENFVAKDGPAFDVEIIAPANADPQSQFTIRANITNTGDLPAHGVAVTLNGVTIISGANPANIGMVDPSATPFVEWTVEAGAMVGGYPFSVDIVSNSYGESFTGQGSGEYVVGQGEFIISNMPGNDGSQSTTLNGGRIKAMGFTMGASDYLLDQVQLRLNITDLNADLLVRIFDDVDGLPTNSIITLTNPPLTATGISNYIFTPATPVTLERETPYWLVVYNTHSTGMGWMGNNPVVLPTGIATHSGSLWNSDTGPNPPVSPSSIINTYAIIGTVGGSCYANCDGSTSEPILNVDDFTCFINAFASAQSLTHEQQIAHYSNCDGSTQSPVLNVDDFTCFINAFAQGCP